VRKFFFLAAFVGLSSVAFADNSWANVASSSGTFAYLGLGLGLTYLRDGDLKVDHSLRVADSCTTAFVLSEGASYLIHSQRPDGSDFQSFPSTHTAVTFAMASMVSHYHPSEAPLWYAGSSAIAYSRIVLQKHRPIDLIGGAGLGYGVSWLELRSKKGLLIEPFVVPTDKGLIVSLRGSW
jgi:membrane-associated phospholipid phosphatase